MPAGDTFSNLIKRRTQLDFLPTITTAIMADAQVTLRTRKFIRNPLLGRKQMVVCVFPDALHSAAQKTSGTRY
jgi:hypothetical protein